MTIIVRGFLGPFLLTYGLESGGIPSGVPNTSYFNGRAFNTSCFDASQNVTKVPTISYADPRQSSILF